MKNAPQYSPEFVGADTRVIVQTELLKIQQVLSEMANSIENLSEQVNAFQASSQNADAALENQISDTSGRVDALENP